MDGSMDGWSKGSDYYSLDIMEIIGKPYPHADPEIDTRSGPAQRQARQHTCLAPFFLAYEQRQLRPPVHLAIISMSIFS